ncbi:MAG: 2-iminoacetate synthase ThiH [Deltaproteobacteria bacterium]|nr:2-iminoacetate synthase ThiH [Deltaproteobacteria bacterium]
MNSLSEIFESQSLDLFNELLKNEDPEPVKKALLAPKKSPQDFALLLSKGASEILEEMAGKAHTITRARFGNAVNLYAPLYVSNKCKGTCPYCGFKQSEKIKRVTLGMDEILQEARVLKELGILQILLVSGTGRDAGVEYLTAITRELKKMFPSVTVEVPPLDEDDYKKLMESGVDGVTLYQETYNRNIYDNLHRQSIKEDFNYRLNALSRAGNVGMRKLNIGVLWGLSPWRMDAFLMGLHGKYLENNYWKSQILMGMPRLHHTPSDFTIPHPVSDRDFVQIIIASRLFLNDAGIVISTRENQDFRNNLLNIGATMFSAGSKTEPGGYSAGNSSGAQFGIDDMRTPKQVEQDLITLGFDPVFKDWDRGFIG